METSLGAVGLIVADLDAASAFYETAIGLRVLDRDGDTVRLGTAPASPLVELTGRPDAPPRPPRTTGLFHFALLVPGRAELAEVVRRAAGAGWTFTGASDHLVSEALYLNDPEGNGIEIYRDRPREEWRYAGGELQMATLPLDLDAVMAELPRGDGDRDAGMPQGTRMGHVHLQVADIGAAEGFYSGRLGFAPTVRGYPGALFVSAGGYHHHVGLNTWAGTGRPPPPPGSRGLDWFEVRPGDSDELAGALDRVSGERTGDGVLVSDPSANRVLLRPPR